MGERTEIYLCPRCLNPGEKEGPCSVCGTEVLHCRPGEPDDPCRRPLQDREGKIRTRAPRWWLEHQLGSLMDQLD